MSDHPLKPKIIPSAINPTGSTPNNDADRGKAKVSLAEEVEWLNRLNSSKDFQRFVLSVKGESMASRRKIRDIESITSLTVEQRAAYGQKLALQLDLTEWVDDRLAFCMASIKTLDEQSKLQS